MRANPLRMTWILIDYKPSCAFLCGFCLEVGFFLLMFKSSLKILSFGVGRDYLNTLFAGADPENFSRGGPTLSKIDSV